MRPILAVTINYIYMERTYVFNQEPNGGGSKFDIMALLPNLMGGKGVDPGLLALLNQGRNNQDAWGGGMWWIWIILLCGSAGAVTDSEVLATGAGFLPS